MWLMSAIIKIVRLKLMSAIPHDAAWPKIFSGLFKYLTVSDIFELSIPVDTSVLQFGGKLVDKKVAVEPAKVAQNIQHRRRHPQMEGNQCRAQHMTKQKLAIK